MLGAAPLVRSNPCNCTVAASNLEDAEGGCPNVRAAPHRHDPAPLNRQVLGDDDLVAGQRHDGQTGGENRLSSALASAMACRSEPAPLSSPSPPSVSPPALGRRGRAPPPARPTPAPAPRPRATARPHPARAPHHYRQSHPSPSHSFVACNRTLCGLAYRFQPCFGYVQPTQLPTHAPCNPHRDTPGPCARPRPPGRPTSHRGNRARILASTAPQPGAAMVYGAKGARR